MCDMSFHGRYQSRGVGEDLLEACVALKHTTNKVSSIKTESVVWIELRGNTFNMYT